MVQVISHKTQVRVRILNGSLLCRQQSTIKHRGTGSIFAILAISRLMTLSRLGEFRLGGSMWRRRENLTKGKGKGQGFWINLPPFDDTKFYAGFSGEPTCSTGTADTLEWAHQAA